MSLMRTPNEVVFFQVGCNYIQPACTFTEYCGAIVKGVFTFVFNLNSDVSNFFFRHQVNCQEGILHISNGVTDKEYCLVYNHSWTPLSQTLEAAVSVQFSFWTLFCNYDLN